MIQNLISAVLVSMAVGGNTATAFIKEPKQAITPTTISQNLPSIFTNHTPNKIEDANSTKNALRFDGNLHTDSYNIQANLYIWCNEAISDEAYNNGQNSYVYYGEDSSNNTNLENWYILILQVSCYATTKINNLTYTMNENYILANYTDADSVSIDTEQIQAFAQTSDTYAEYLNIINYNNENIYSNIRNEIVNNNTDILQKQRQTWYDEVDEASIPFLLTHPYVNNSQAYYNSMYYLQCGRIGTSYQAPGQVSISYAEMSNNTPGMIFNQNNSISFNVLIDTGGGGGNTIEVLPISNLMYQVLTMPFAFISQAFNLVLWPNTPYQVNIGNIFIVVIAVLMLLFLARIILRAGK